MRLDEILNLTEAPEDGTFAGVRFLPEDAQKLEQFAIENDVPNPCPASKMHVTLLFSKTPVLDYEPHGPLKKAMIAHAKEAKIFGDDDERVLVLVLECPELIKRHKFLMNKHKEATWDHDEYIPHVTLSYDCGDFDPKTLDISGLSMLTLVEEYGDDIDPTWKD